MNGGQVLLLLLEWGQVLLLEWGQVLLLEWGQVLLLVPSPFIRL